MAKRFNDELNADIRRTLRNAIQKVRRAEKRGEKGLPTIPMVREFKAMYATEQDAKRELAQYRTILNNKEALKRHRTKDGTISNWEFDYIANNLKDTKKWVTRELFKARERLKAYPDYLIATKADISKLEDELSILSRDIDNLTAQELKVVSGVIGRNKRKDLKTRTGRTYFMRNLDYLLTAKGMNKTARKEIASKINELSNEEFLELYKTHDIISEVMISIPSDPKNDLQDAEQAYNQEGVKEAIEDFVDNLDGYIFDATTQAEITNKEFLAKIKSGKL